MDNTPKKSHEFNKLIAEFMYPNFKKPNDANDLIYLETCGNEYWIFACLCAEDFEGLGFHKDWNALIKVLDKIIKMEAETMSSLERDHYDYLTVLPNGYDRDLIYIKCIKFIKSYNKRLKNSCCDNEKRSINGGCLNCGDPSF